MAEASRPNPHPHVGPATRQRNAQVAAEAAERRRKAWELRKGGASLREIMRMLSVSLGTAHKYIKSGVADYNLRTSEDVREHRALELARLDGLFQSAWMGATGARSDPTFMLRAIQIIRERARLIGLYAPIRIDLSPSELAHQLVKEFAARGEELNYEMAVEEAERVVRGE